MVVRGMSVNIGEQALNFNDKASQEIPRRQPP